MDLKQLESFVRVAELRSFSRAATALQLAQPALSRQVRLLEVELRQTLLIRNGRGATPTEAGQLLLAHARGILHQVARAREELGSVRGSLAGRVVVGMPTSLARLLAVPLIRAFRAQLPDATLSIREGLSAGLQESLLDGRLDIAVVYSAHPRAELEITPLVEEELVLVHSRAKSAAPEQAPELPVTPSALAALPLVIPSRPNAIRMQVESELALLGKRLSIALEIDGISAILDLVADGAGSAVLTRHAVMQSGRPQDFAVRPIGQPPLRTPVFTAISAQRPTTRTQQMALGLIQDAARSLLGSQSNAQ